MASNAPPERTLPFSGWWPVGVGGLTGLALRLVFMGAPGKAYSAMAFALVLLGPIAVGAVTVYFAERQQRRTLGYHVAASLGATALYVSGSLLILVEGLICAILIVPLFALLGLGGGLIMLLVCRLTNWPTQTLTCIVALPLALGAVEADFPLPDNVLQIERAVVIDAPPEAVWRELTDAATFVPRKSTVRGCSASVCRCRSRGACSTGASSTPPCQLGACGWRRTSISTR